MTHSNLHDATDTESKTSHDLPVIKPGTDAAPPHATDTLKISLGEQFRAAREARGLDIATCGQTLRLPVRILQKLEAGDYTGIEHGVYLRNYLTSYALCVGLPEDVVLEAIAHLAPSERKPELVSTSGVSRSHYLWHRYTTAATSIVLTAVIVVPLIWLGVKSGLDRELTQVEPLNPVPVTTSQKSTTLPVPIQPSTTTANQSSTSQPEGDHPLMASLAPFSALDRVGQPQPKAAPAAIAVPHQHTLSITLSKPSWVDVATADGDKLVYSLLPAGTHRTWQVDEPLHVSIGDATGSRVSLDGKAIDLDAYERAKVAHFRIALKNGQASVQAM